DDAGCGGLVQVILNIILRDAKSIGREPAAQQQTPKQNDHAHRKSSHGAFHSCLLPGSQSAHEGGRAVSSPLVSPQLPSEGGSAASGDGTTNGLPRASRPARFTPLELLRKKLKH